MKRSVCGLIALISAVTAMLAQTSPNKDAVSEKVDTETSEAKLERLVVTGSHLLHGKSIPREACVTKSGPEEAPVVTQNQINRALVEFIREQAKKIESLETNLKALQERLNAIEQHKTEE